jgi:hypothetical protein
MRNLFAIAALLGGDEVMEGVSRIIDGQCPDCGKELCKGCEGCSFEGDGSCHSCYQEATDERN